MDPNELKTDDKGDKSIMICFSDVNTPPQALKVMKCICEDVVALGYYISKIDNGNNLGNDMQGKLIDNEWGFIGRFHLKKIKSE